MSNQHAAPMENTNVPVIMCGKSGVICMDHMGFGLFCGMLYGDRNPNVYADLREYIEQTIRKYKVEVNVREIIGHMCEMALKKATANGGWQVDNHMAYLTTVARNKIAKEYEYMRSHSHREIGICEEFLISGDVYTRSETKEIIQKSIRILEKIYPRDFLIIQAMLVGNYENDTLSRHLGLDNDAKLRKAKQRAQDRMKEVVLDVMGRGPDGFRMQDNIKRYKTNEWVELNIKINNNCATRNFRSEMIIEKYYRLINFIFHGNSMQGTDDMKNGNGFRTSTEWMKDAA